MSKEELLKAIEIGESVWIIRNNNAEQVKFSKINKVDGSSIELNIGNLVVVNTTLNNIFKTKAKAEHYLHHANITRTETLPFLTWEEFKQRGTVYFRDKYFDEYKLLRDVIWNDNKNTTEYCLKIHCLTTFNTIKLYNYTEENFYKAYDECVKLFKGCEYE